MDTLKTCTKCKEAKPATTEFWHRHNQTKDGLRPSCKVCHSAVVRKSHARMVIDPETGQEMTANALASKKSYGRIVIDPVTGNQIKAGSLAFYNHLRKSPLAKLRWQIASLIHSSMRHRGWSKTTKTQQLVGCDFQTLLAHLQETLPDHASHQSVHIDHFVPCSVASTPDELMALQHYTNLRWLPREENLSKSDSLPDDWEAMFENLKRIYKETKMNELVFENDEGMESPIYLPSGLVVDAAEIKGLDISSLGLGDEDYAYLTEENPNY